ncbi:hypothetical protein D9758_010428 [Tetrapyrgos nigripes]|uniref:Uncharacterized protein n=1 Tax=Tetrapyrgos nigripes TaxID=182062 RepID=A0A8H5FQK1_9AGAR|nr:hypothetical protein D9758_010428 [Tetrapyrgos nigripes]
MATHFLYEPRRIYGFPLSDEYMFHLGQKLLGTRNATLSRVELSALMLLEFHKIKAYLQQLCLRVLPPGRRYEVTIAYMNGEPYSFLDVTDIFNDMTEVELPVEPLEQLRFALARDGCKTEANWHLSVQDWFRMRRTPVDYGHRD